MYTKARFSVPVMVDVDQSGRDRRLLGNDTCSERKCLHLILAFRCCQR